MEKFRMDDDTKDLELFSSFVNKTKDSVSEFINRIRDIIKGHEQTIEDTKKEIVMNENAREKCQKEIVKMENKIVSIKGNIDNVESTYRKIVDAYSSTSKGDTKEIYSDIIDVAKNNCEKDVEKNRYEIERLLSDIDAIKNNISEFTKTVSELKQDLKNYETEIVKYNSVLEYFNNLEAQIIDDLDDISIMRFPKKRKSALAYKDYEENSDDDTDDGDYNSFEPAIHLDNIINPDNSNIFDSLLKPDKKQEIEKSIDELKKEQSKLEQSKREIEELLASKQELEKASDERKPSIQEENIFNNLLDEEKSEPKSETVEPIKIEEQKLESADNKSTFEDSLKQIYDLTGYKPKKEEVPNINQTKNEVPNIIQPKPIKRDETRKRNVANLEGFFKEPPIEPVSSAFDESNMSEWEKLLNGTSDDEINNVEETPLEPSTRTLLDSATETVNQLLKPYGTTFERLTSLIDNKISYKNGSQIPFSLDSKDLIKAINEINSNDLKEMKKFGPEITLLRKVKRLKEGKN